MSAASAVGKVVVPPLIVGGLFIGVWEVVVHLFDIKPFLLPAPSAIWTALRDNWSDVWDAMLVTGQNAFVGLVLGIVVGVALSFVLMRFRVAHELVTPLAIALNAIPIIVIVPVLFAIVVALPMALVVVVVPMLVIMVMAVFV